MSQENVAIRFCIPALRTKLVLAEPWTFTVYNEYRNHSLYEILGHQQTYQHEEYGVDIGNCTLPKGTNLSVDRIYIRNGKSDYDSVTFRIASCPEARFHKKKIRFWAKLADVNAIKCYPIGSDPKTHEMFKAFIMPGQRFLDL